VTGTKKVSTPHRLVAAVVGRGTGAGTGRGARQAGTLASAAQPSAAHTVLLVESNGDRRRALDVAGLAAEPARCASHQRDVSWCNLCVCPPSLERASAGDVVRGHGAVAVHASGLLELVALLGAALEQRAVVLVLAQELVRAVAAVLHAVASLLVWNDLAADAQEPVRHASTGDVVARWLCANRDCGECYKQENALEHGC